MSVFFGGKGRSEFTFIVEHLHLSVTPIFCDRSIVVELRDRD